MVRRRGYFTRWNDFYLPSLCSKGCGVITVCLCSAPRGNNSLFVSLLVQDRLCLEHPTVADTAVATESSDDDQPKLPCIWNCRTVRTLFCSNKLFERCKKCICYPALYLVRKESSQHLFISFIKVKQSAWRSACLFLLYLIRILRSLQFRCWCCNFYLAKYVQCKLRKFVATFCVWVDIKAVFFVKNNLVLFKRVTLLRNRIGKS